MLQLYEERPDEAKAQFGDKPFELKNVLNHWVRSNVKDFHVIPTDTLYLTIDKDAVRRSGMLLQGDSIPDHMVISLKGKNALYKGDLMMLEMIANANWTRPIYVATTVGSENYMNLGDNFVQEGLANRITPFTTNINGSVVPGMKNFDTEKTYENVMKRFKFGNVKQEGIYLDETVMRMCYTHRRLLSQLAINLVNEGKKKEAAQVLALCEQELPTYNVPVDYTSGSLDMVRAYIGIGDKANAKELLMKLWEKSRQYMRWYCSLSGLRFAGSQQDCMLHLYVMQQLTQQAAKVDESLGDKLDKEIIGILDRYQKMGGTLGF